MAEDSVEGSAYLRALKRLDDPAAAAAPAPESPAADRSSEDRPNEDGFNYIGDEGNSGPRFKGAEKRRSHRYKCEGKAELREEGRDVRTWATFRDVSLHGCYIEVQATYPVGTTIEGEVVSFTSHGAMVDVALPDGGSLHCYIPLSAMGDPPPTKARQVLTKGAVRPFLLSSLDPPRRVAELSLPETDAKKRRGTAKKAAGAAR